MSIQEAERLVSEKSNEELQTMLSRPSDWQSSVLDAAKAELQKRGATLNLAQPELPLSTSGLATCIFGDLSLIVFGGAVFAFFYLARELPDLHGEAAFGCILGAIVAGCYISIPSLFLGIIGLARRESPRWPAITGTALSVFPALGGFYTACGAPL